MNCWSIDQAAIYQLPAWKQRVVRIALNRIVRLQVLVYNTDPYCERTER